MIGDFTPLYCNHRSEYVLRCNKLTGHPYCEDACKSGLCPRTKKYVELQAKLKATEADNRKLREALEKDKSTPKVICLCGSTRFKGAYIIANKNETLKGHIVLSVGLFGHADKEPMSEETKTMLDELHKRKIDLADEVLILNVGGYIGRSTRSEIAYAQKHGKVVRYYEARDTLKQIGDKHE
jgi:hypothetical protein